MKHDGHGGLIIGLFDVKDDKLVESYNIVFPITKKKINIKAIRDFCCGIP